VSAPLGRGDFVHAKDFIYLNHAAAGLLPRRTCDRLVELVEAQGELGVLGVYKTERRIPEIRERVGRFIGAEAAEIAFLRNTGDGANVVARGLDWNPGDEVILSANEFGANALPWVALGEYGALMRFVDTPRERMTPDVLRRLISPKTRVVAVSWVSFTDGYRHDLAALAEIAHAHGALFCVDAIQALGAFPLDVKALGIDALYAGGAKWLLALPGVSFLYVDRNLIERLSVRWRGWKDVADIWDFLDYDQPFADGAARFEGGTQNFIGMEALETSMDVIAEAGLERIAPHVLALTDRLVAGLERRGAEILSVRGPRVSSGIVTFRLPGVDSIELGRRLGKANVVTTYRSNGVRVSPHGHNSADDIDALLDTLPRSR
jgi:selenocysteine lyase/cysteine desulfurase